VSLATPAALRTLQRALYGTAKRGPRMPPVKPVREPDDRNGHVRLCVQKRLARSVGASPTEARVRSLVAGWQGGGKPRPWSPSTNPSLGWGASHRAVTRVNAEVASKVTSPRGRARNRRAKAAWSVAA
jgi:hypothetical protein